MDIGMVFLSIGTDNARFPNAEYTKYIVETQ